MSLYAFEGHSPELPDDGSVYIAPGAAVIGRVALGREASVWFNAVLRGDNEPISVGAGTNLQDGVLCHTDPGYPLGIGPGVTVGHAAVLHGCEIGGNSLIGMGAMVMNGARIGRNCMIGARALVTEGKEIPDGALVMGAPGKVVRMLDDAAIAALVRAAAVYRDKLARYRDGLTPL